MATYPVDIPGNSELLDFLLLPEGSSHVLHIVAIFKNRSCQAWSVNFAHGFGSCTIEPCSIDNLPEDGSSYDELHMATAINPVGWEESIDKVGRDVLSVVNKDGFVRIFYTSFTDNSIKWHLKNSFMTAIKDCTFLTGSSVNKLAIVNSSYDELTIWDTKLGTLQYEEKLDGDDKIKDIDWTSTDLHQSILAVGFKLHSVLYTQLRFDYTNKLPSFAKIKKVNIENQTTHEIGDSIWMRDGLLVIGSGNQFYISDKRLDPSTDMVTRQAIVFDSTYVHR
ncbi:unnamed protein product [Ambrosiozyma monospora]|uniref:Unnamed protein product n=1 Tax=Ambrosiozyma monospora TaxID=43982 RepID=A0ACB5TTU3_AMBMO|nr:unnamed protein product [Ambrosiozyma monospora]